MFKMASFEEELYRSMEKNLVSNQTENVYGFKKLAQAIDDLNAAAHIFEQAGMSDQAAQITEVLQELSDQFDKTQ